jgi:hypothetical protein
VAEGTEFYDPNACDTSLGGRELGGWADGTMIEISPEADDYELKSGTRGAVAATRIYNRIRTVKLRFQKTSPSNDIMSSIRRTGRAATGRAIASVFDFADGSGTSKLTGKAVIKSKPTQAFGASGAEAWEWTLYVVVADEADEFAGGNSTFA